LLAESELDPVLRLMAAGDYAAVRRHVDETLGRGDAVFGRTGSDFAYYLNLGPGSVCLDAACGLGAHAFNIAPLVAEVHALDRSSKRLEFCAHRRRFEGVRNVHLVHGDVRQMPFEGDRFDAAVMSRAIHHVGVMRELHRCLKPGGTLYLGSPRRAAVGKLLVEAGFRRERVATYIAHPSHDAPRYIVPFDDIAALQFFVTSLLGHDHNVSPASTPPRARLTAALADLADRWPLLLRLARHLSASFALFAQK
jgi:SAM-dependent methyltransferase